MVREKKDFTRRQVTGITNTFAMLAVTVTLLLGSSLSALGCVIASFFIVFAIRLMISLPPTYE